MDAVGPVRDTVKDVVPIVKRYVKYQICHNVSVNKFKEMQTKLEHRRADVAATLHNQLMQRGKIAKQEVEAWLKAAEQETAENVVEDLICKGGCLTYICSSRKLDKRTQSLNEGIFNEGEKYTNAGESLVIDDPSIKGVPQLVEECRGRDDIKDQILERLKGNEVTRIAVSGMGGVGKTTIVKQVHNQLLNESKFNKVIWVKVSEKDKKKFDILEFQKRIAISLGLKLEDPVNETVLVGLISQTLWQGSFLLILDDVWQQFNLEDVGIPNPDGNNGCKLVRTTRLQDVARAMECEVISVNPLPPDEALALFLEKVGGAVLLNGRIKRDIEPVLKQILQKCGGVPLAIVTVAKTMRGKLDPRSWKLALAKLSKFEGKFEGIVHCLKYSYECLESQCQKCFLYCALYPEDYEIPREELIECWIEEEFIYKEGETRDMMNCEGHDMLEKLVDNCLLELVNKYGKGCVSMHDLLRDMALEIISQFLVKAGVALQKLPAEHEWREDLLKVSLMQNHITEIPSSMPSPKYPMLTTLLLSNNKISTIPEAFFEHMLGLKILDLSNNRELSWLPTSISKLEKLTTLLLEDCKSLREVPSLFNLVCLRKLILFGTSIEELPQGLNMLTNLKYLCLGGRLSGILDKLLHNLSKLQYLMVPATTKFKCEMIGSWGKLQNLEVLDLCNLDNLDEVFGETGTVAKSAPLPVGTFSSLQHINVSNCNKIKKLFSVRWVRYLQKLQTIKVNSCEQLEEIIGSESEEGEEVTLPELESLTLFQLPQLKSICSGSLICDSIKKIEIVFLEYLDLSSLKYIHVWKCDKIKKLFSVRWLEYLQKLQTIKVDECEQLEEIIGPESEEREKVTLPELESLELRNLPQLKRIYSGSLICDSIKEIQIRSCDIIERVFWSGFNPLPNLEYLCLKNLDDLECVFDEEALGLSPLQPPTNSFSLKKIRVELCHGLKKVFSSGWLLGYFQSLEIIEVYMSAAMEELISSLAHEEEKVTLPKLQSLKFHLLPSLKSICSGSNVLICDSIKSLQFSMCSKLKMIPLNFPLLDNAQSSHPSSLQEIVVDTKREWESLEWDHPNAKDILLPFCKIRYGGDS